MTTVFPRKLKGKAMECPSILQDLYAIKPELSISRWKVEERKVSSSTSSVKSSWRSRRGFQ